MGTRSTSTSRLGPTLFADPRNRSTVIALIAILCLAACGGSPSPTLAPSGTTVPPPKHATPAVSAVAVARVAPGLGEVLWTVDVDPATDAPLSVASRYPADAPHLTAAALATNLPRGTTIEASWSYNDTPLEAFATRLELENDAAKRWISFRLDRDPETPWPPGTYAIALSLDGIPAQSATVVVSEAP